MKLRYLLIFSLTICLSSMATTGFAEKPVSSDDPAEYLGNGFPSGPHHNLLIHGKNITFSCPQPEFYLEVLVDNNGDDDEGLLVTACDDGDVCETTDVQIFGNVINVPRDQGNDPISILMESGRKGPKSNPDTVGLEVIDWCTESFPDDGSIPPPLGDPAVMRLEKNDLGYAVYGRVLGKPGEDGGPVFNMIPSLELVQDEGGNDLILLGFVTPTGVFNPEGLPINRYDSGAKGKGAKKATNLSPVFQWTGEVCYVQEDSALYCYDEYSNYICSDLELCCVDSDLDGVYEECNLLTEVGIDPDEDGNFECPLTAETVIGACRHYDNYWVFNIADFVDVLWAVTHDGIYNVQIRFYPLPLN